ncbi:MAG: NAD-dependent epimerase/dehydratase family protein [Flavobacterium sp.]|nr:MAG: NAD-dependent epimerase/dehydratase family protein [Flavobacterium sp.]
MGKKILITGSSGLIGSEVCLHFANREWEVHGIDNNQRAVFFGPQGDTRWNQTRLEKHITNFVHHEFDVRDRDGILKIVQEIKPDAIVHAAAQPSHDRAASMPFEDFDTNAVGTFNMLEATRRYSTSIPFIHLSTNKVYGDLPNTIRMQEFDKRYDYADETFRHGIPENFGIDQSKHSLFGASKLAGDICVQEFGRYFNMPTVCLRGGCLTGPNHTGVELHGFLSEYTVFGYKGKQVRDNIHSIDVANFIESFIAQPRVGEVYNIGGGKGNTCSILEAFDLISGISGKPMRWKYDESARSGDHVCYYSDLRKMKEHYPKWEITKSLEDIFVEIYNAWQSRG